MQVFGEGSMGPLSGAMRAYRVAHIGDLRYDIPWTSLAEYLVHLERRGIAPNVASFVNLPTVITLVGGYSRECVELHLQTVREVVTALRAAEGC